MLYFCDKHGDTPYTVSVSQSIFNCVRSSTCLIDHFNCVCIIYPNWGNRILMPYLDEDDFLLVSGYIRSRSLHLNRRNTLISILGSVKGCEIADNYLFLIDRDTLKKEINDRLFLVKLQRRLKGVCPECLQEKLGEVASDFPKKIIENMIKNNRESRQKPCN